MIKKSKVIACLYAGIVAANAMEDYLSQFGDNFLKDGFLYQGMEDINEQNQAPSTIVTIKNDNNKIMPEKINKVPSILSTDNKQNKSSISVNNFKKNPQQSKIADETNQFAKIDYSKFIQIEGTSRSTVYIITKLKINDEALENKEYTVDYSIVNEVKRQYNLQKKQCPEKIWISKNAFANLQSDHLRLNLDLLTKYGIAIKFPKDCSELFKGSDALYEVHFPAEKSSIVSITNANGMFKYCLNLQKIDFGGFDTSEIQNMECMFYGCENLQTLDLRNFKTGKVEDMASMFYGCKNLTNLNISNFNTENVICMERMFYGCGHLQTLDLRDFKTGKVEDMAFMFYGCKNLTNLNIISFNTENVIWMESMFCGCENLQTLDLCNFTTEKVEDMAAMFCSCKTLSSLNIRSFNTENVTWMEGMFCNCRNLQELDLRNFKTGKVKNMASMFCSCETLSSLNITSFNTENVIRMDCMFCDCRNLQKLNLQNFKTEKVTHMEVMFGDCSSLKQVDLSSFNTRHVRYMREMFYRCKELKELDLRNFSADNLTGMGEMFCGCLNLEKLNLSKLEFAPSQMTYGMFCSCPSLSSKLNQNIFVMATPHICDLIENQSTYVLDKEMKWVVENMPLRYASMLDKDRLPAAEDSARRHNLMDYMKYKNTESTKTKK